MGAEGGGRSSGRRKGGGRGRQPLNLGFPTVDIG